MTTVFTFPGQGAQRPLTLQHLPKHPQVREVIEQAEEGLGVSLGALDSAEALKDTVNVQLSLLICGVAWGRYLQANDITPAYVLGLSIGAYPAAVVAGCLRFADALSLVKTRGELMKRAYPSGYGMLAITGTVFEQVQAVVEALQDQGKRIYLANLNAPKQFVLAGDQASLKQASERVRKKGSGTSSLLDVAVPSHCPLLSEQSKQLLEAFQHIELDEPVVRYVSAAKARMIKQASAIKEDLALNMAQQLHWHDSCEMLVERGVTKAIEMPPGSTLTSLFRNTLRHGVCYSVENTKLNTLCFGGRQ